MRLVVDLNRCQGYAQCVFLAPDVFELRGNEALHFDPNPDDAERLRVLRAAAACPVQRGFGALGAQNPTPPVRARAWAVASAGSEANCVK